MWTPERVRRGERGSREPNLIENALVAGQAILGQAGDAVGFAAHFNKFQAHGFNEALVADFLEIFHGYRQGFFLPGFFNDQGLLAGFKIEQGCQFHPANKP